MSQEAGKVVWYSNLFMNFSVCCDPHKDFGIVNKADVFLALSCFFDDLTDVGNLISGSSDSIFSCMYAIPVPLST